MLIETSVEHRLLDLAAEIHELDGRGIVPFESITLCSQELLVVGGSNHPAHRRNPVTQAFSRLGPNRQPIHVP